MIIQADIFFSLTYFKVFKQLNLPPETHLSLSDDEGEIDRARRPWEIVPIGHKIGKPEPLFKELVCPAVPSLLPVICFFFFLHVIRLMSDE